MKFDREHGTIFIVMYRGQSLRMHFSPETKTFGDVQNMAATYFGLPRHLVFLSDKAERGVIYMADQGLREILYPMRTAKRTLVTHVLYVILQRKMSDTDFLTNGRDLREAVAEAVNEVEAQHNLVQDKEAAEDRAKVLFELREQVKRKYW